MRFSIIIPTYNRDALLVNCLKSLINQNYPKKLYEIIIVDDGSSDATKKYIKFLMKKFYNIKYFKIGHSGQAIARNHGLKKANGKFIAFTDDDCIVERDWLKKIEYYFKKTDADAIGGSIFNPTNRYIAWSHYILNFSSWFPKGKIRYVKDIPTANVAYRKKSIKNHSFSSGFGEWGYTDSLFNYELYKKRKKIIFCPDIKAEHYKWDNDCGLNKFLQIQKRVAIGFAMGGYKVHGDIGGILMKFKILNLLCPRLGMVFLRCVRYGFLTKLLLHLPLILLGELYRGVVILKIKGARR